MTARRAVVFDFDGTIVDTEAVSHVAWREVFAAHGAALADEELERCIGTRGGFDLYGALVDRAVRPVPPEPELRAAKLARAFELLLDEPPRPGVVGWVEDAEAAGVALGVASSSDPAWVEAHLDRLGLRHRFAVLSCWDGTCAVKPAPDLFLRACDELGVEPQHAVAVEDSPNGVAAAVDAGLFCVATPHGLTEGMDLSRAHLVVRSLAELALADALALAARR